MKQNKRTTGQPTIADVAKAAGVSNATAARVLGGYGYAGTDARERVFEAAKQLAYQPNQLARSMVTGRTMTIGVVVADIQNLYFARAIRAITDTAKANGFAVILANTDEDIELEREAVRVLLANRVDGLIVAPTSEVELEHLVNARNAGCPFVLLDRRVPALNADTFAIDNFSAAHEAVTALIEAGHTRIAVVSNARVEGDTRRLTSPVRERIDGYRAALNDAKITHDSELIIMGGWDPDNLDRKLHEVCQSQDRPTAFLALTSSVALILLNVLRDLDLSIPEDASLISFDDADWATAITPPVTVVSQPIKQLAAAATEDLIAHLSDKALESGKEILMPATLIKRGSVSQVVAEHPSRKSR